MEDAKEARALQEPLLPTAARDWRGRPAHGRLGGWKCASCILGATGLCLLAFYGVLFNLVIFLVQTGETNAAAATTVATLSGTQYLCSFLGAFLSDAFMGRLWTSLVFQVLLTKSIILVGVSMMTASSATGLSRVFLSMSLYMMAITTGPVLPNILCLGVDQLDSKEDKEMYFQLMAVATAVGQLLAATVVTYVDSEGMWVWGFGLCAVASLTSLILVAGGLRWFRRYRATGNPFLRNSQVLVAALRKHRLAVPTDSTLLHEYKGDISAIPGCRKLPHTPTLSFLDKAAVLEVANTSSQWRLCTVTQVEELKSLLRVIPATFAMLFTTLAVTQVSTLFEEQAVLMNRNFGSSFAVPPASLNVLAIISGIITGLVTAAGGGARLSRWCLGRIEQTPSRRASSLFLLGISLMCSISSMVISALVEMCRLNVAHNGIIISVLWLVPQTILLGVATNLATSSSLDFCYSEISESMRSVGGSIVLISCGAGSYLNSILVAVVTTITSCGGRAGWIANNLDEGHADYFYWCLACCLAFGLGVHIAYARAYKYTGRK
ncbi:hypothetical protein GOP47_0013517 [Adiantum capillus-veneris]|uniref:Uncharacterized protein n=1 Tax=Adiantum capillus-veneris TaxID=13818 RepID=A0A9D4UPD3_ADICA|nr:hypothetical protein GOP47_0013517 [Adiantum capillus-veneris]